jgi:hypothetical protein
MFATVPTPGRCRIGIQHSSTSAPTIAVTVPNDRPVRRDSASCSTSHGSSPNPDLIIRAMLTPYSVRPPSNCGSRRTGAVVTGTGFRSRAVMWPWFWLIGPLSRANLQELDL